MKRCRLVLNTLKTPEDARKMVPDGFQCATKMKHQNTSSSTSNQASSTSLHLSALPSKNSSIVSNGLGTKRHCSPGSDDRNDGSRVVSKTSFSDVISEGLNGSISNMHICVFCWNINFYRRHMFFPALFPVFAKMRYG